MIEELPAQATKQQTLLSAFGPLSKQRSEPLVSSTSSPPAVPRQISDPTPLSIPRVKPAGASASSSPLKRNANAMAALREKSVCVLQYCAYK